MADQGRRRYMSGAEALRVGIITEGELVEAFKHPWAWCSVSGKPWLRFREIPWQGLEVEEL